MTYGGGPEGGIVRLRSSVTSAALWYVWHRDWGRPASILRIPGELTPVSRHDDGYEAIKLVMDDYELGDDEHYLDDMEDTVEDEDDSEYRVRNDDDDEANEGQREDNIETEDEDEVEDEADNIQAFMNNERRGEIASLEGDISDYNDRMENETSPSGIMTFITLINMAEGRCRELREQIASSRQY